MTPWAGVTIQAATGLQNLSVPRTMPWGRSVSINHIRGPGRRRISARTTNLIGNFLFFAGVFAQFAQNEFGHWAGETA